MPTPVDLGARATALPVFEGRTRHTTDAEMRGVFAKIGQLGEAELYLGSWAGESEWEVHPAGDELVQVVSGRVRITIAMPDGDEHHDLADGGLIVVPRGRWHRFETDGVVTVLTATPPPTEHWHGKDAPPAR